MALFSDIDKLYQSIKSALPSGWSFTENSSINDPVWRYIPSGKFSLWTTPSGEQLVVVIRKTSLTGSERGKPQIRLTTDNIYIAYNYAKQNNLSVCLYLIVPQVPILPLLSIGILFETPLTRRFSMRALRKIVALATGSSVKLR